MTTSPRPDIMPWVTPHIIVKDVDAAVAFYKKAFGFNTYKAIPGEDGTTWHASLQYKDGMLMFGKQGAWGNTTQPPVMSNVDSPINMYLYCDDVDTFHDQAVAAGAKSVSPPEDTFWGDRMCMLKDIDGYHWAFATQL